MVSHLPLIAKSPVWGLEDRNGRRCLDVEELHGIGLGGEHARDADVEQEGVALGHAQRARGELRRPGGGRLVVGWGTENGVWMGEEMGVGGGGNTAFEERWGGGKLVKMKTTRPEKA